MVVTFTDTKWCVPKKHTPRYRWTYTVETGGPETKNGWGFGRAGRGTWRDGGSVFQQLTGSGRVWDACPKNHWISSHWSFGDTRTLRKTESNPIYRTVQWFSGWCFFSQFLGGFVFSHVDFPWDYILFMNSRSHYFFPINSFRFEVLEFLRPYGTMKSSMMTFRWRFPIKPKIGQQETISPRWFKVTFVFPVGGHLTFERAPDHHPKKVTKNCQAPILLLMTLILPSLRLTAKAPKNGGFQVRNLQNSGGSHFQVLSLYVLGRVRLICQFWWRYSWWRGAEGITLVVTRSQGISPGNLRWIQKITQYFKRIYYTYNIYIYIYIFFPSHHFG